MALYLFIYHTERASTPSAGTPSDRVLATIIVKGTESESAESQARRHLEENGHAVMRLAVARGPLPKRISGVCDDTLMQVYEAERRGIGVRFIDFPKDYKPGAAH